jgi:putative ABC transport system substrate-binding protein
MRRRDFIAALAGAAGYPVTVRAQQDRGTRRVGVFPALAADEPVFKARFEVFQRELERLGWLSGRNLQLDYRFGAGQSDRCSYDTGRHRATPGDAGHTNRVLRCF